MELCKVGAPRSAAEHVNGADAVRSMPPRDEIGSRNQPAQMPDSDSIIWITVLFYQCCQNATVCGAIAPVIVHSPTVYPPVIHS
jgi:hypothetical protein